MILGHFDNFPVHPCFILDEILLKIQVFSVKNFEIRHSYGKSIPENNIETFAEYLEARGMNSRDFAKKSQKYSQFS